MEDISENVGHANVASSLTIKEEPDERPLSGTGTRHEDFESDGDHPILRASKCFMRDPAGLGVQEKYELSPLLRDWDKQDAAHPVKIPLTFPRKYKDDTRIIVGKWSQTLPKPTTKRKMDDDDDKSPTPSPKKAKRLTVREKARLRGEPAYLAVGCCTGKGADKVIFDFKDESGQMAASQYIDWESTSDMAELRRHSLEKWERNERTRIREFNQRRLIIAARNYLIGTAAVGFAEGHRPSAPYPQNIEMREPQSAFAIFARETLENAKIVEELAAEFCYI
ncbi:hypothetical protein DER46DRAFT_675172 [Fusarium sp. MPI-SDFR-AT-0072]|nr:hypothetical protein DER46DRAFT_675172 [Fusarium sp. MPI-SDFR-AT-0072]